MPAGGYESTPAGIAWLEKRFKSIDRAIESVRSSAGILSAVIGKGGITVKDGGGVRIDGGAMTVTDGSIRVLDSDTGASLAYFGALEVGGLPAIGILAQNSEGVPYFWVYKSDGTKVFNFTGDIASIAASDTINLTCDSLRLYGLPTTGSAANLRLETTGGTPEVQWVTSSLRYKVDPADAEIDLDDVLRMQGRTWVDKGTMERLEAAGEDTSGIIRNVGFIAEELDALLSLRQFVDYDDEGRPDAIQYDRLTVPLVELAKSQQQQIDALSARLDALEAKDN